MKRGAYYNEHDPAAAEWLRELIRAGKIAPGDVDERSIEDVTPEDLAGYRQCHFFAGIGVWSYALRCAGVADSAPVWTGSCPCQPFSSAGKGAGFADERHLWPAWHWLIEQCRPGFVFGEQVANRAGLGWLRLVQADLEGSGYRCGAVDLCAAGVGAPQIRQRLFFVARAGSQRFDGKRIRLQPRESRQAGDETPGGREVGLLAGAANGRPETGRGDGGHPEAQRGRRSDANGCGSASGRDARTIPGAQTEGASQGEPNRRIADSALPSSPLRRFWRGADWLYCRDGKYRPVEPGSFPLASGIAGRVGLLRGYGNALCAPAATAFIEAVREELSWIPGPDHDCDRAGCSSVGHVQEKPAEPAGGK